MVLPKIRNFVRVFFFSILAINVSTFLAAEDSAGIDSVNKISESVQQVENIQTVDSPDASAVRSTENISAEETLAESASFERQNGETAEPTESNSTSSTVEHQKNIQSISDEEKKSKVSITQDKTFSPEDSSSSNKAMFGWMVSPYLSGGVFAPVADFADRYHSASSFSFGAYIHRYIFYGFVPCVEVSYFSIKTIHNPRYYDAKLSSVSFLIGESFWTDWKPPFFNNSFSFYAKINAGVSRVLFVSEKKSSDCIDYVQTVRLASGVVYPIKNAFIGGEGGFEYIATSGTPIQSVQINIIAGITL